MLAIRTANCALVRYEGGHIYVDRADGHARRELYVEMRGVRDREHARSIAIEIIRHWQDQASTLVVQGSVFETAQIPTTAYGLGDLMDGKPIASLTITSDDLGTPTVRPELEDPFQLWEQRTQRRLARIASGATSEWAAPVTDSQDQGSSSDATPPEFSLSGVVEKSLSPAWVVPRPFHVSWLEANLVTAGSTATVVRLYRTDLAGITKVVGAVTIPAGAKRRVAIINEGYATKTKLVIGCVAAGIGATDLTAAARGAMV